LICYQPFYGGISALYFAYNMDNYEWGAWLSGSPVLYTLWGLLILLCLAIYGFATVMFGIRFSNLTNRGIITNGPYRFVKHPAYLSKNLSWWLVAVPFVSQTNDVSVIIKSCLMLMSFNAIYYIRAKTEERHLMSDPVYREYSEWIRVNGSIAKMKRSLGFTRDSDD
jgi:protein-S-isoprenylcysteine O-methyltransferase Ste14